MAMNEVGTYIFREIVIDEKTSDVFIHVYVHKSKT